MAAKKSGVATQLATQYPLALYTHCASHCLNLVVVASFDVCSMMGVANQLAVFFFSHPNRQKLKEAIQNTQPESNVKKKKVFC